jgi:hypothetical protein
MTWGRENSSSYPYYEHQQLTTDAYNIMADIFDTEVSPVGAAWKKIRDENDPVDLYDPDGSHPDYEGSYLAACVFYATIFDKSPVGLSFTGSLSTADATYLQEKAFEAYNEYVSLGLIHTGISEDTVCDVYRAVLNNSQSELNSLIANGVLNTTFDFTYTGFSTQSQVNTTLEYVINQSGNQLADETMPVSMTIQPNVCVNQTATYPLIMDLTGVNQGAFDVEILLNGNMIAYYNLEMPLTFSEFNLAENIVLYPNPIRNQLSIRLPRSYKRINAKIINPTGQVILETNIQDKDDFKLHLKNLSPGVYLLKLDVDGYQVTKILINEKE